MIFSASKLNAPRNEKLFRFCPLGSFVHVVVRRVWKRSKIVSAVAAAAEVSSSSSSFEAAAKSVLIVIVTTASGRGRSSQSLLLSPTFLGKVVIVTW